MGTFTGKRYYLHNNGDVLLVVNGEEVAQRRRISLCPGRLAVKYIGTRGRDCYTCE